MLETAGARTPYDYYIIGGDGNVLYTSDFSFLNKRYNEDMAHTEKNEVISVSSDYNNWRYVYTYPKNNGGNSFLIILLFLFLSVIASAVISYLISLRILNPLGNILSEVEKISPYSPEDDVSDEIKYISRNLLSAFSSYQNAEKELEGKLALLKKSQTVALQSQINPHFLFNTLETINLKAAKYFKGENDISSMISSLSRLLRLGIETQEHLTTVAKEIEHAKTFVEILSVRYADKVSVVWDIEKAVLSNKICKITLQPIIENAMYHGIKPLPGHGVISIKMKSDGNFIGIEVADNGVGMSDEKITELNERIKNGYIKEDASIGISNVNQRIKLVLGESCKLTFMKNELSGITVKIIIPKV
jgi:two-component system sensor histidine kinase YesM